MISRNVNDDMQSLKNEQKERKETRVYMIMLPESNQDESELSLSDEKFMNEAERQGHVYTLKGFEQLYNSDFLNSESYIRFIDILINE